MAPVGCGGRGSGERPEDAFLRRVIEGQLTQGLPGATPSEVEQSTSRVMASMRRRNAIAYGRARRLGVVRGVDPGAAFRMRMRRIILPGRESRREFCYGCGHVGHPLPHCPLMMLSSDDNPLIMMLGRVESGYIMSGGQMMCTYCTQVGHARSWCPMLRSMEGDQQVPPRGGPEVPVVVEAEEQEQTSSDPRAGGSGDAGASPSTCISCAFPFCLPSYYYSC